MADRRDYFKQRYQAKKEEMEKLKSMVKTSPTQLTLVSNDVKTVENNVNTSVEHVVSQGVHSGTQLTQEDTSLNKCDQVKTVFAHPLAYYLTTAAILIFLFANTAFLVTEQVRFYTLAGYTEIHAIFLSVLLESAAIFLAFFGTWYQRPALFLILAPTLVAICAIIVLGLKRGQSADKTNKKISEVLEAEISQLNEQKTAINSLLGESKGTEKELKKIQTKLETKQEELRGVLAKTSTVNFSAELWILALIRILAMIWNVVFASLLAPKQRKKIPLFPKAC